MRISIFPLIPICLIFFFSCATTPHFETETIVPEKIMFEEVIESAEAGDIHAQVQVGISFEEGNGVPIDYDEAYKWYRKAASKGSNEAYYRVGRCFEFGYSVEKNWDSALEWYLSSATTGYLPAISKMIKLNEANEEEQQKWILSGVKNNDPYSFYRYGLIIEKTDPERALELYKKAQSTDDSIARGIFSIISLRQEYPFYEKSTSINNLINAAEMGDPRCQVFLGWLYEFGSIVPKSVNKAFELYESASQKNEILSFYNLSRFYGEGINVNINLQISEQFYNQIPEEYSSQSLVDLIDFTSEMNFIEQQKILYRLKASREDTEAMYHLGLLSKPIEASQWFWMAAMKGHTEAMVALAKIYLNNGSEEYDPIKAASWLMVAENKSGEIQEDISSLDLLKNMNESDKLKVSKLFTEIYYSVKTRHALSQQ
jgi:TPR repeat protein